MLAFGQEEIKRTVGAGNEPVDGAGDVVLEFPHAEPPTAAPRAPPVAELPRSAAAGASGSYESRNRYLPPRSACMVNFTSGDGRGYPEEGSREEAFPVC